MNDPSTSPPALGHVSGLLDPRASAAGLRLGEVWRRPLPHLADDPLTRFLCRLVTSLARRYVIEVEGLEHVAPERDPFILALNHSQRHEAALVPTLLIYHRRGKLLHFMADWNFMLMPFVATLYRRSRVILVTRKDAVWRPLNVFRPLFAEELPALERARLRLEGGASIGVFPESTINRDPDRLLRGSTGAARLSLRTGAPLVPAGIRFPGHEPGRPIRDGEPMKITIGPPIEPPRVVRNGEPPLGEVRELHQTLMQSIARAAGKSWSPRARRRRPPCR